MNTPPCLPRPPEPREPATFASMRTCGELPPTYRHNRRRGTRAGLALRLLLALGACAAVVVWLMNVKL